MSVFFKYLLNEISCTYITSSSKGKISKVHNLKFCIFHRNSLIWFNKIRLYVNCLISILDRKLEETVCSTHIRRY